MIFRRAILRLTLTYTLVQLLLFAAFGIGIYAFVTGTFDFDTGRADGPGAVTAAEQGFAALRTGLLVGYAVLVILLPCSSYLMARAAFTPIRKSYESQQRFVDGASHELRTPLSVIQGELELAVTRSRTPAQYRTAIASALDAVGGLTRLTDDLLLLSRDSTDELETTFTPVSLNELVAGVVASRSTAENTGLVVTLGPPLEVKGSRELLARAIANVLDNAIKFTPPGGAITVSTATAGSMGVIVVHDTGVGMTPPEVQHAFDRFWRAQDARTTPGYGLGLPLVEQICQSHKGRVSLSSVPGGGTTVTMSLPLCGPPTATWA